MVNIITDVYDLINKKQVEELIYYQIKQLAERVSSDNEFDKVRIKISISLVSKYI